VGVLDPLDASARFQEVEVFVVEIGITGKEGLISKTGYIR
jgi:hypothetical protein